MTPGSAVGILRSDHVGFVVASLEPAIRFWVEGLGGRLLRRAEMGGEFLGQVTGAQGATVRTAVIDLAGQAVELLEYRNAPGQAGASRPFDPGFAHLALVVGDLDAVLVRIAEFGWRAQGTPQVIAGGVRAGTRAVYAVGPDGETIEFMQTPPAAPPDPSG